MKEKARKVSRSLKIFIKAQKLVGIIANPECPFPSWMKFHNFQKKFSQYNFPLHRAKIEKLKLLIKTLGKIFRKRVQNEKDFIYHTRLIKTIEAYGTSTNR